MTPTLTYTLGRFVWRELFTRDVEAAKRFYSGLFGWTFEDRPMGPDWSYTLWKTGDKQIGGMMDLAHLPNEDAHVPPHWAVYVSVADVDSAVERAVAEGGRVLGDCFDIPGVGRFAVVQDPQGAVFNVFRSLTGDPEDKMPTTHEFCWEGLTTTDAAKAADFYGKVVGWQTESMGEAGMIFNRATAQGPAGVASIGEATGDAPPHWMSFVAVEGIADRTARARELGAEVFVEPTEIPGIGAFAILADPTGAIINLFEAARDCG